MKVCIREGILFHLPNGMIKIMCNMKYIVLICVFLMLTGCTARKDENPLQNLTDTSIPAQTQIADPTFAEPELLLPLIDPKDTDFVRVTDYIPGIFVEPKYSTEDNFTGQIIYDFQDVFLRYGTVVKLKAVAAEAEQRGFGLKIWDGFRPVSAQFKLWEVCPDDTYVADPNKGYSNHSRGFAVDLTLVDLAGREVEMPTGFDDFSEMANRDYSDCTEEAAVNARFLEQIMEKAGFSGYWGEWWHFNDTQQYDVETCLDPSVIQRKATVQDSPLLERFSEPSSEIMSVPAGSNVTLLGYDEGFALVEFWGYRGYIAMEDLG